MKIIFVEGRDNGYLEYFAISQLEVYKGKAHDELMWAEITPSEDTFKVTWEDDWKNPIYVSSIESAKQHVLTMYTKHRPHINGHSFNIDEL